jgi:GNAT superfamily N-acetyltransferase
VKVRTAEPGEVDRLAQLWFDGWQDAHLELLPVALRRFRTLESFRERLHAALPDVRVVGPVGEPAGFSIVQGDELYQLYVSASARGTGLAAALIADAESRIAQSGIATAWLACAIGKHGWRRIGTIVSHLDTPDGMFPLEVWRYEKHLSPPAVTDKSRYS